MKNFHPNSTACFSLGVNNFIGIQGGGQVFNIFEGVTIFIKIKKRDGRVVNFNAQKITEAIAKAGAATNEFDEKIAQKLTLKVLNLTQQALTHKIPTVDEIQDIVRQCLMR